MQGVAKVSTTIFMRESALVDWDTVSFSCEEREEVSAGQVGQGEHVYPVKDDAGNALVMVEVAVDFTPYATEE